MYTMLKVDRELAKDIAIALSIWLVITIIYLVILNY